MERLQRALQQQMKIETVPGKERWELLKLDPRLVDVLRVVRSAIIDDQKPQRLLEVNPVVKVIQDFRAAMMDVLGKMNRVDSVQALEVIHFELELKTFLANLLIALTKLSEFSQIEALELSDKEVLLLNRDIVKKRRVRNNFLSLKNFARVVDLSYFEK